MAEQPAESVQMVVTSPPYWGLRKYSGEQDLIWGGEKNCQHSWLEDTIKATGGLTEKQTTNSGSFFQATRGLCQLCGAWRGAFGLEPTPEMYVQHTIQILREIRRVLRKDGVVFWNIGDSYFGGGHGYGNPITGKQATNKGTTNDEQREYHYKVQNASHTVLKPKDLCLIPFRVAIAAQEDGWWVRSDIIWSKPNPMPESVTDRPTNSHEYILMFTKSSKYYWDPGAVREDAISTGPRGGSFYNNNGWHEAALGKPSWTGNRSENWPEVGRNLRDVWTIATQPYKPAHFATYTEKLPELCIKAASGPDDIILDPFAGSGTSLWVAKKLNRQAIGYELSEEYCRLAVERCNQQAFNFALE